MLRLHCKTALRRRDFKEIMQSCKNADIPLFLLVRVPSCEAREGLVVLCLWNHGRLSQCYMSQLNSV